MSALPKPGTLTPARRRSLAVLAHGLARRSNVTRANVDHRGELVCWQTADWLVEQGLAYYPGGPPVLALTDKGRNLARSEGLL